MKRALTSVLVNLIVFQQLIRGLTVFKRFKQDLLGFIDVLAKLERVFLVFSFKRALTSVLVKSTGFQQLVRGFTGFFFQKSFDRVGSSMSGFYRVALESLLIPQLSRPGGPFMCK